MKIESIPELDKLLDEYEKNASLSITKPQEHEKYMNLTYEEIKAMPPDECGIGVYILERYAAYLQKQINRENARIGWCRENIKRILSQYIDSYSPYKKYDEREQLALKESEAAGKLESLRQYAQARLDRLAFLPGKINLISAALLNVQKTKTFVNKNRLSESF